MGFIIDFFKKIFFDEDKRRQNTMKKYKCKDGRILYPVKCRKCGKRTNTTDKETAQRGLYVCSKCVPRKKKK